MNCAPAGPGVSVCPHNLPSLSSCVGPGPGRIPWLRHGLCLVDSEHERGECRKEVPKDLRNFRHARVVSSTGLLNSSGTPFATYSPPIILPSRGLRRSCFEPATEAMPCKGDRAQSTLCARLVSLHEYPHGSRAPFSAPPLSRQTGPSTASVQRYSGAC